METLRIRNIKSFADSGEIAIKPITIFVGKNSCGKSSLMRFLAVLAQTADTITDSPIRFYGNMVDYGNYEDVKHYGTSEKICFELKYKIDVSLSRGYYSHFTDSFRTTYYNSANRKSIDYKDVILKVTLDKPKNRLVVDRIELVIANKSVYIIQRTDDKHMSFTVNYIYEKKAYIENTNSIIIPISKIRFEKFLPLYPIEDAIKCIYYNETGKEISETEMSYIHSNISDFGESKKKGSTLDAKKTVTIMKQFRYYANLLWNVYRTYETEIRAVRYIGPFREDPSRIYRDPEYNSNGVGVHGENTSNELIRAYRKKDSDLIKNISKWTKRVLGSEITLKEVTSGMLQIMLKNEQGFETNIIDNGYGISQVLPIVTEVARLSTISDRRNMGPMDRILLIEQPELHLHPAAQSELADLFAECALMKKYNNRILIETHSEHLIRKLQVLVASEDCPLTKDMIRIYYVDKNEDGSSFVKEMALLDNGKFETQWPSGFFDKGYLLSRELARAGIRE